MTREELVAAIREHAYLEGDFLLRSGKRSHFYFDKYRFETRPELLRPLGELIADKVADHAPDADRLARFARGRGAGGCCRHQTGWSRLVFHSDRT